MDEDYRLNKDLEAPEVPATNIIKAVESNNALPEQGRVAESEFIKDAESRIKARYSIPAVRTFESDAASFIEDKKESIYSIREAEKKKKGNFFNSESEVKKTNGALLILSAMIILGGISFSLYFLFLRTTLTEVPVPKNFNTIIKADTESSIDVTDGDNSKILIGLKKILSSKPGNTNSVENISINTSGVKTDSSTIISSITDSAPGSMLRALSKNTYMIGSIQKEIKKPFFILSVDNHDQVFAGTLKWENEMFKLIGNIITGGSDVKTEDTFNDAVVKNHDVRIMRDTSGKSAILYSFYDDKTFIITTDEDTLSIIFDKIRESKLSR